MKKLMLTIFAGLLSVGLYAQDNDSYIKQVWDNNYAVVDQQGESNISSLYQIGTAWNTYKNEAFVTQIGHDNWVGLYQIGQGNHFEATQMGHNNFIGDIAGAYKYQAGYMNSATIKQDGYDQESRSSQQGSNNFLNVHQYDYDHLSRVIQEGAQNGVWVSQRN